MNLEEMQRFTEEKKLSKTEQKRIKEEQLVKERQLAQDWVKANQMFKDLIDTPERKELFKKCRDYLILEVMAKTIGRNNYHTADWAKGYIDGIDTFIGIVDTYDAKRNKYKI